MIFKNSKFYDVLKYLALIGLPALGTLWFAIGTIWGLPYVKEIDATILAVTTFIGTLIGVSGMRYKLQNKEGNQ